MIGLLHALFTHKHFSVSLKPLLHSSCALLLKYSLASGNYFIPEGMDMLVHSVSSIVLRPLPRKAPKLTNLDQFLGKTLQSLLV
jgi:hypothetical protein